MDLPKFDPYKAVNELCDALEKAGQSDWKNKIRDAVAGGATGTEILMHVNWVIKEMIKSAKLDKALTVQAKEISKQINKGLLSF